MNSETRPLIFSLLTVLMWGLWGFFGKLALEKRMAPTTIFLAETLVSAFLAVLLFLWIVQRHDAEPSLHSTVNVYGILSGVVLAVGLLFYYFALEGAKVTVIVPLTATYPVVAVLLGYLVLRERPSPLQWIGVILVVAGVALLLSGPSKGREP
jgi:transporter family protein